MKLSKKETQAMYALLGIGVASFAVTIWSLKAIQVLKHNALIAALSAPKFVAVLGVCQ